MNRYAGNLLLAVIAAALIGLLAFDVTSKGTVAPTKNEEGHGHEKE